MICRVCEHEKDISDFYASRVEHGDYICKECGRQYDREWKKNHIKSEAQILRERSYAREYRKEYSKKPHVQKYIKQYSQSEKCKNYRAKYQRSDEYKELRKKLRNTPEMRKKAWEYIRSRMEVDVSFQLDRRFGTAIYQSLRSGKNGHKWSTIVGYGAADLRKRIESQFINGMSWDNYGEWHIDHIVPKSLFHYTSYEDKDFKKCWSLDNLQPLWAKDNLAKGNRMTI